MKRAVWLALLPWLAAAHVMSMSTGDVTIEGARAHYELRMPIYEIAHVKNAEAALFDHIRLATEGQAARLAAKTCREQAAAGYYGCIAEFEFPREVGRLEVECTLHAITVPNHVHLLRAMRGGKRDQALFDISFQKATLRFEPPGAVEMAVTQIGSGVARALGGAVQILFLAALVLAARSRRELAALAGAFVAGQAASALISPWINWQPPARFVEAASALTVAYLAVEVLLLPEAGRRWAVAAILGAFHGLYFALFLRETDYSAGYVLAGAAVAEWAAIALLGLVLSRLGKLTRALRPVQVSASLLFAFGMVWFFLRLRG